MRRTTAAAFALILAAAPATLDAQVRAVRPPQQPRAAALQQQPVPGVVHADRILAYREELGLTAQQVNRIRGLRNQLIEENQPLLAKLQAQRGAMPLGAQRMQQLQQQRQRLDQQAQQLRMRMQQQRQQMNQLTEEQRQQMRQQMQLRQDSMRTLMQQSTVEQRQALRAAQQQRMRGAGVGGAQGQRGLGAGVGGAQGQRGLGAGVGGAAGARGFGAALGLDEETRAALQEARENARQIVEQIDATLTAEQRAKLRELRPGRIGR